MATKDASIKFFKTVASAKGKHKFTNEAFNCALDGLAPAVSEGFTEEEIETLVGALVTHKFPATRFNAVLRFIVPKANVSEAAVTEILLWLFSFNYNSTAISSAILVLQWVTGLLDFGLTKEEYVDAFYEFFFEFLNNPKLEVHASKLVHMLTKPDDISQWRVKSLLKIYQKNNELKHTKAILCHFKSFRPECVPQNVPFINVLSAFRDIPAGMSTQFHKAQLRKQADEGKPGDLVEEIVWGAGDNVRLSVAAKRAKKNNLIPPVDYIQYGLSKFKEHAPCSILQFKTIESLGCYQLSLDIPCQTMSLLVNKAGCHVLLFGDLRLQERISFVLYNQLYSAFITRNIRVPDETKKMLLIKLIAFETYMQQGIPVVSRMLAEIIPLWNGRDFRKQIFKLLEWITFSSFEELDTMILENMHKFFVESDVEEKCLIIATLKRLLANSFLEVYRRQKGFPLLFMRDLPLWDSVEVLTRLTRFIQDLCAHGLHFDPNSALLIHESLSFYEMVSQLENRTDLALWTIMTPGIFYRGIFTSNFVIMSRVCALLLRYKNIDVNRLKILGVRSDFKDQFEMINMYAADLLNCLRDGKTKTNRENGLIFKDMPRREIRRLSKLFDLDNAFNYNNHYAFRPFYIPGELKNQSKMESILENIEKHMPALSKILYNHGDVFLTNH